MSKTNALEIAGKVGPLIWFVLRNLYGPYIRGIIAAAIEDPDSSADEKMMEVLDKLFGYK